MMIYVYTDGCCRGNPGPGGIGVIIKENGKTIRTIGKGFKNTTNNRMELLAVIIGISFTAKNSDITVITDSNYVVSAFNKNWITDWKNNDWKNSRGKSIKNIDLWKEIVSLTDDRRVKFQWVKGHSTHLENIQCDRIANNAAEGKYGKLMHDIL